MGTQFEMSFEASKQNPDNSGTIETNTENIIQEQQNNKARTDSIFISALDLINQKDIKQEFLIEGIIHRGTVACLTGPSDLGKSMLARQFAVDIALGRSESAGFKINTKHNKAIYLTTEDGKRDWQEKLLK